MINLPNNNESDWAKYTKLHQLPLSFAKSRKLYIQKANKPLCTCSFGWMRGNPRFRCPSIGLELKLLFVLVSSFMCRTWLNKRICWVFIRLTIVSTYVAIELIQWFHLRQNSSLTRSAANTFRRIVLSNAPNAFLSQFVIVHIFASYNGSGMIRDL